MNKVRDELVQSQTVSDEAKEVDDGIRNGNMATKGVKIVQAAAREEQMIAQPGFNALTNTNEESAPITAKAGNSHRIG